ncbi:MAG: glycosyltransferase family 10 [Planctomycetota bacterium]
MTASDPINVKMLADEGWLRQFPGGDPVWGRCRFVFDPDARDYDWLVVYEDVYRAETLACAAAHTLLVTTEPSSIKTYGSAYLNQFGVVLTSQEPWALRHRDVVRGQPALKWFYGWPLRHPDAPRRSYEAMASGPPVEKSRTISTLCSEKQQTHTLHRTRYRFTHHLKAALPELDIFGWGNLELVDKAEGIDAYRYHLAIENHHAPHHWTEKLADPFLGLALPFYAGCPNAADYFPPESFIPLDLNDFDGAVETIRAAIAEDAYTKRLPAIREARRRVMEQYNFFAVVAGLIEARHPVSDSGDAGRSAQRVLYPRRVARRRNPWRSIRYAGENARVKIRGRVGRWAEAQRRG